MVVVVFFQRKKNTGDLSDPKCEMENGSPAKASGGSGLSQIYIIKRVNIIHLHQSPAAAQQLPSVLTTQHQVRYLALHNADSAGITLKVAELQ